MYAVHLLNIMNMLELIYYFQLSLVLQATDWPLQGMQRYLCILINLLTSNRTSFCLFVCLRFNGTISTNRLYRAITVG